MEVKHKIQLINDDPYLAPYEHHFLHLKQTIDHLYSTYHHEQGLDHLSQSYKHYGLHKEGLVYVYREWAPEAQYLSIFGEFNNWKRGQYVATKNQFGLWTCQIDEEIAEFCALKVEVRLKDGSMADRIPAWINFTRQNKDNSFDGVYVSLGGYKWEHSKPCWQNKGVKIYQCHVGMSGVEEKVHSFTHFKDQVLPRIKNLGYNVIQIMGVVEHPYYGSFGYHCSSYFSVSSRFGTPADFKQLVDEAHRLDIKVIIDLVHSHAAKNSNEGINFWDGTDYQYFHGGQKGDHPLWDSKVFDYSKFQVQRFLLSNIRFWLQEYNTDGYRFDAVTSILYEHHGNNYSFSGNYNEYFNHMLNTNALAYLSIANQLAKIIYPQVLLIAEDVSGFPGLCRPFQEGGIGFSFRLALAIPDMWIKLIKECKDQHWDIEDISHRLTNKRWGQPCISYAQSHDQAIVGDKTLAMWLFDSQIYTNMSVLSEETPKIFRGMALHKMIRLITMSLGSDGYMCFMGNEFGHPQWVDFPREGNNWSYQYCRRRWDLLDREDLRYKHLFNFDKEMMGLDREYKIISSDYQYIRQKHKANQILTYQRASLLFVFNFHPNNSYQEYPIYAKSCKAAKVILSTDDHSSGGHQRVCHQTYEVQKIDDFIVSFLLYIPSRCAIVLQLQL